MSPADLIKFIDGLESAAICTLIKSAYFTVMFEVIWERQSVSRKISEEGEVTAAIRVGCFTVF